MLKYLLLFTEFMTSEIPPALDRSLFFLLLQGAQVN